MRFCGCMSVCVCNQQFSSCSKIKTPATTIVGQNFQPQFNLVVETFSRNFVVVRLVVVCYCCNCCRYNFRCCATPNDKCSRAFVGSPFFTANCCDGETFLLPLFLFYYASGCCCCYVFCNCPVAIFVAIYYKDFRLICNCFATKSALKAVRAKVNGTKLALWLRCVVVVGRTLAIKTFLTFYVAYICQSGCQRAAFANLVA